MLFSKILMAAAYVCISTIAVAQTNGDSTSEPRHSYFKFSLSYLSNAVYNGRKDSSVLPYLNPTISWHDKGGFYLAAGISYLAGEGAQIDAGELTAGYEFENRDGKLSGDLYGTKYFISNGSYSVKGEVKGALGASLNYNLGPVALGGGADLAFSGKTDIGINMGLGHVFELGNDKNWSVNPSIQLNAGTQSFYENYLKKRKYSQGRRRRGSVTAAPSNIIVVSKSFAVLDYELSLPVEYTGHKWGLFFAPVFSIPENGFKYSINNGVTYLSENLSNSFYAELGAYIKF